MRAYISASTALVMLGLLSGVAQAHDPVFGIGPHVLFKNGVELAIETNAKKRGDAKEQELMLEVKYGITGDWAIGIDLPYVRDEVAGQSASGVGDVSLFTKYRFWRQDSLGLQESAALFFKVVTDTAAKDTLPSLAKGATDGILGLTYGYEGRKWYRWASVRYRANGTSDNGLQRGDKVLVDFVGGIRPKPTGYLEPDTVWLLELNGEYTRQADLNGLPLDNTGGSEWFLSPGIFWTRRYFAIKAGVQIPVYSRLNGSQPKSDYRARLIFEWHL